MQASLSDDLKTKLISELFEKKEAEKGLVEAEKGLVEAEKGLVEAETRIGVLETELLFLKNSLHSRGVIEEFERAESARMRISSENRVKLWEAILNSKENQDLLSELDKCFDSRKSVKQLAHNIRDLYSRLSENIHQHYVSSRKIYLVKSELQTAANVKALEMMCRKLRLEYEIIERDTPRMSYSNLASE